MQIKRKVTQLLVMTLLLITTSCSDDDSPSPEIHNGDYLIGVQVMNTETFDGRGYVQLIDELKGQSLDNSNAISTPICFPKYVGNDIFIFPSYIGVTDDRLTKYTKQGTQITETGSMPLPSKSSATNLVIKSQTKAYLSVAGLGKIWAFNPQTMKKIAEIDLTHLAVFDNNPDPGAMLIRDNLLYVGLNQLGPKFMPYEERPVADVAIIDTEKDELVKMISEKTSHMSCATRPVAENTIFMDENKDIYVVCIGGFGAYPNHNTGLLRIKAGDTEFDKNYSWALNQTPIEGDPNKTSLIQSAYYAGNGKLYSYLLIPQYVSDMNKLYTEYANIAVELDIYKQSIKKIKDIPLSNSYAVGAYGYKNDIVFCNYSKNTSGFYTYNPLSAETKHLVTTTGFANTFRYYGK